MLKGVNNYENVKIPPLDQRKKRGFCKYHSFLGHKTSQCFLFRDLIQNAIKDGRLKFADKMKMKVDEDPLDVADTNYSEPACIGEVNMVEIDRSDTLTGEKDIEVENWVMVEVSEEVTEGIQNTPDTSIVGPVTVAGETQATEGQGDHNEGFTQVTEGLSLELEKVQITQPVPSQKV